MTGSPLRTVILGLSITSSWGNGHATTFRGLVRELAARGHDVTFLERDVPWYAQNRDLPEPPWGRTELCGDLDELRDRFAATIAAADAVIVGTYVPDGVAVGEWVIRTARGVTACYDIDTPVTLAKLARGDHEYLAPALIPAFDLYLSFTGGPTLDRLEREFGAKRARRLYCSVDPKLYAPQPSEPRWDLGYLGTYSDDRQPGLQRLLIDAATASTRHRFVVAGPQYPDTIAWPGLDAILRPGEEILIARSVEETLRHLRDTPERERRRRIGERARERVLAEHTAAHRAEELEGYLLEVAGGAIAAG